MIFSPLPLVLLLPGVVAWLIFSRLPAVIVAAVACLIFSVQFLLPALHVAAVPWPIVFVLFLPVARHGSILNSNVSPSTILCHRLLDSSKSLLPNALSFRNPCSETRCSGDIRPSFGEYCVRFVFEMSSIFFTYVESIFEGP